MKCKELFECLSEYIDKEMDREMEGIVEEHLRECERCIALFHTLEKMLFLSRQWHKKEFSTPKRVIKQVYYELKIKYKK